MWMWWERFSGCGFVDEVKFKVAEERESGDDTLLRRRVTHARATKHRVGYHQRNWELHTPFSFLPTRNRLIGRLHRGIET